MAEEEGRWRRKEGGLGQSASEELRGGSGRPVQRGILNTHAPSPALPRPPPPLSSMPR